MKMNNRQKRVWRSAFRIMAAYARDRWGAASPLQCHLAGAAAVSRSTGKATAMGGAGFPVSGSIGDVLMDDSVLCRSVLATSLAAGLSPGELPRMIDFAKRFVEERWGEILRKDAEDADEPLAELFAQPMEPMPW